MHTATVSAPCSASLTPPHQQRTRRRAERRTALTHTLPSSPLLCNQQPEIRQSGLHAFEASRSTSMRSSVVVRAVASSKAKGPKVRFVCTKCGFEHIKRQGQCSECGGWACLEQRQVLPEGDARAGGSVGINASKMVSKMMANNQQGVRSKGWVGSSNSASIEGLPDTTALQDVEVQSMRTLGKYRHTRPSRFALSGSTGEEVNRVLGGGVVPGSLVLVGGDPGVGKSTLLLQIAGMLAAPGLDFDALVDGKQGVSQQQVQGQVQGQQQQGQVQSVAENSSKEEQQQTEEEELGEGEDEWEEVDSDESDENEESKDPAAITRRVLYVSGEEMADQVYDRAARMGLGDCTSLYVLSDYRMEAVCAQVYRLQPAALVVDSIQTMSLAELNNPMGSPIQLIECCNCLKQLAQSYKMAVFTIGHMTKSNQIAGPKAMIHMVDVVLRLEEDMSQAFRMLRADKNRNGSTAEMGVFSMDSGGMRAVEDLSAQFLASRSTSSVSSALTVTMDSSRPLAMEVQALVTSQPPQSQTPPIRQPSGVNRERLAPVIVSVLHKFVLRLHNQNIVVSITGGLQMREPAADLAIAVAIVSGYYNSPIPRDMVVIGEIDLGGGLRPVKSLDARLAEVAKLGIKSAVIPMPHYQDELSKLRRDPRLKGLTLLPCSKLIDAMVAVLGKKVGAQLGARKADKAEWQQEEKAGYSRKGRGSRALSSAAVVEEVYDDEDGPQDKWEKEQDSEEQEEEPWEREEELMYKE